MSDAEQSDIELMARLQKGDDSAFNQLFSRHYQRALNIVYRYLGAESEAEDIAQRVFLKIYEKRMSYTPSAKFTTFLYQVVGNLCLNIRRDRARRKTYAASSYASETGEFDAVMMAEEDSQDAAESMVLDERAKQVRDALQELPEKQRMAIVLSHYEGLAHKEVGEAMEISANAAKQLCHRAREALRKALIAKL